VLESEEQIAGDSWRKEATAQGQRHEQFAGRAGQKNDGIEHGQDANIAAARHGG